MPNTFTKAPVVGIDTILENRRFRAYMTGARDTDWFFENGQDYSDSRAKWDGVGRQLLAGGFNVGTASSGCGWVAPFSCTLKGFTAIGAITTGTHAWRAGLFVHDATYPITDANMGFDDVVIDTIAGSDDDMDRATGTCDIALAVGDLVLPAVSRGSGLVTNETIYGSFSFWVERD